MMHQLIDKLNLVDLTVAYGMSASGPLMYFAADSDGHIVAETRWDRFPPTLEGSVDLVSQSGLLPVHT